MALKLLGPPCSPIPRGEAPVQSTFTHLRPTGTKADCCALAFFAFQPFQLDVGTVFMTLRPFEAGVKSAFAQLNREPMRGSDIYIYIICFNLSSSDIVKNIVNTTVL